MNYDELTDDQKEIWDEGYSEGHDAGYDLAWYEYTEAEDEKATWEEFDAGFEKGVLAERQRVQDVLNMMFEAALNMGQGNKAVQYRQMMELLTPVQIQPDTEEDF